jgi:class 3 adenylate cyclase
MLLPESPAKAVPHRGRRVPFAWRIALSSSAVLVTLIVAMLAYVNFQAHRFVTDRIAADLLQGRTRTETIIEDQFSTLTLTAQLVADIPALKALLSNTDSPTIRDFLLSYQERNHSPDLLIALDAAGRVLARTDSSRSDAIPDVQSTWIGRVLAGDQGVRGTLPAHDAIYNAVMVPCEADAARFGFVLAGSRVDNAFAHKLSEASHGEIIILGKHLLGSTLPAHQLPWATAESWRSDSGNTTGRRRVWIGAEAYSVLPILLSYPGAPTVIGLQSDDKALAPYRRIQVGLLILGLLGTGLGIASSAVLARHVTAPIAELVQGTHKVASGNFDFRLNVPRGDEIGDLAQSFNNMTKGLRERADMQRFVSQSTLEMIQSTRQRTHAGERKLLTILFSDIRGFTALSERMPPEQVVNILNRILTLQAERVKAFSGDIDKYIGDAIMALFQGQNAALDAIHCATEIQQSIQAYNASISPNEPRIEVGIGVASGEVILGSIGSEDRRDFTAIGSHVNLCARLCSLAKPREILVAESTYQQVRNLVRTERLEPQHVKGFSEAVPVYRMLAGGYLYPGSD